MRYILVLLAFILTGCSSSLEPIKYQPIAELDTVLAVESIEWDVPKPEKPEVTYEGENVILNREQFAQLIDLYKYAIARRQDVDRLVIMSNAVIDDRNRLLALAKEYESALNAAQYNLSQERSDRMKEEKVYSLQLNILRLLAALAVGYAI